METFQSLGSPHFFSPLQLPPPWPTIISHQDYCSILLIWYPPSLLPSLHSSLFLARQILFKASQTVTTVHKTLQIDHQIKTKWDTTSHPRRWLSSKRQIITRWSGCGEIGTLIYCLWNVKWCSCRGKLSGSSLC
jgi:hypothetical protein